MIELLLPQKLQGIAPTVQLQEMWKIKDDGEEIFSSVCKM